MKKFIFFLAWSGIFFLSLIGVLYVVSPTVLENITLTPFIFKMIILNISILYIIFTLLKIVSKFERNIDYEVKTPEGKVFITSETIKSYVKQVLSHYKDIYVTKVETKKFRNRFDLKISLEASPDKNLAEKTLFIQENIKKDVKNSIGVEITNVELKIIKFRNKDNEVNY
ncbi:MAG: alkaline shock response membrane anchor protein AmaP [Fusobacteriaceae bacterium]